MRNVERKVDEAEHVIYRALILDTSYVVRAALDAALRPPGSPNLMVSERVQLWMDVGGGGP